MTNKKKSHFEKLLKKTGQFTKNGVKWTLFEYTDKAKEHEIFSDEVFVKRPDEDRYHRATDLAHNLVMEMNDPRYDKLPKALKEALWMD